MSDISHYSVRVVRSTKPVPKSKFDILADQLAVLEKEVAERKAYLEGLDKTPFGSTCDGCQAPLETEADFAKHFLVNSMDQLNGHLNLGYCPNVNRDSVKYI
jgi:hypothetical protein